MGREAHVVDFDRRTAIFGLFCRYQTSLKSLLTVRPEKLLEWLFVRIGINLPPESGGSSRGKPGEGGKRSSKGGKWNLKGAKKGEGTK